MRAVCCAIAALLLCTGCSTFESIRSQSPEEPVGPGATRLVGDVAIPYGRDQIEVEGVGLVVGLRDKGSDPPPSVYRSMLLDDMRKRNVPRPDELLASKDTALVLVYGTLRMGMQPGDRFDVEIRTPALGDTKSLAGGYLMEVRLTEKAVIGGDVHEGRLLAKAAGPVLIEGGEGDPTGEIRGRILGGGVALSSHSCGLLLKPEAQQVRYAALIGNQINVRFHTYRNGVREDLATPKTSEFVDLKIHPRYKHNVPRYLRVIRSLPLAETPAQRTARLEVLEKQLQDPITAATAALRLEAIGHEAVPVLLRGLESSDEEVRFYAAEALAYLDHEKSGAAAVVLGNAARNESAFRVYALTALSAMNSFEAREQLCELLHSKSAETRYGAFRALWAMDSHDPMIAGEMLGNRFSYHVVTTSGPPMIHVNNSYRPEIVMFGANQELQTPFTLEAGKNIMITAPAGGPVTVSRFAVGAADQKRQVSTRLDDVIRAVVELEGSYPDVVAFLREASRKELLANGSRLAVDAIPQAGRVYVRKGSSQGAGQQSIVSLNPLPNLFPAMNKQERDDEPALPNTETQPDRKRGYFERMVNYLNLDRRLFR